MFLVVFLLLLGLVYGYPTWRLQSALTPEPWLAWLWIAVIATLALMPVLILLLLRNTDTPTSWHRFASWFSYIGFGSAIIFFDVVVLQDLALGLAWTIDHLATFGVTPAQRADWQRLSAQFCPIAAALLAGYALYQARRTPAVRQVTVRVPGLPTDLDGLRIAHITDLHVGSTIRRNFVASVVRTVQELEADLIAFTGDLADGSVAELSSEVAPLAQLSAPLGVWFSTGNHDYYWDAAAWMTKIEELGLRLVSNNHGVVTRGQSQVLVGGLPDPAGIEALPSDPRHAGDVDAVFAGAPEGLRLLLAHQPATAATAGSCGAALTLSGHTHGGQILPWSLLVRLQQPIVAGLSRRAKAEDGWIYVSRGVGYWGPPMRFGAPSEVACLTLRPARNLRACVLRSYSPPSSSPDRCS